MARKNQSETDVQQSQPTQQGFKHIDYIDVRNDGVLREVAVVKKWDNGSISYIDTALLDNTDKGRLKYVIEGVHSNHYELYELLSQARLSNGMNALDYFHPLVKIKHAEGHINVVSGGGGLNSVKAVANNALIGSQHTDPSQAEVAGTHAR